jgi:hypothetical protein
VIKGTVFYDSATSHLSGHGLDLNAGAELTVFWFFSSEKNILPSATNPLDYLEVSLHTSFHNKIREEG